MNKNDFDFVVGAEVRQTKVVYVFEMLVEILQIYHRISAKWN